MRLGKLVKRKCLADSRNHSEINDPPPGWPVLPSVLCLPLGPLSLAAHLPPPTGAGRLGKGRDAGSEEYTASGGEPSLKQQHHGSV